MEFDARKFASPISLLKIAQILFAIILFAFIAAMYNNEVMVDKNVFGCPLLPGTTPITAGSSTTTTAGTSTTNTNGSTTTTPTGTTTTTGYTETTSTSTVTSAVTTTTTTTAAVTSTSAPTTTTSAKPSGKKINKRAAPAIITTTAIPTTPTPSPSTVDPNKSKECEYNVGKGPKGFMNFTAAEIFIWAVLTLAAIVLGYAHNIQESHTALAVIPELVQAGITILFAFISMCICASNAATLAKYSSAENRYTQSSAELAGSFHTKFTWAAFFWIFQCALHGGTGFIIWWKGWP